MAVPQPTAFTALGTWGRRYALALRDDNFKTSNPYRTLEVSDLFGRDSKLPNAPAEQKEHKTITITKAYWLDSQRHARCHSPGRPSAPGRRRAPLHPWRRMV